MHSISRQNNDFSRNIKKKERNNSHRQYCKENMASDTPTVCYLDPKLPVGICERVE